MTLSVNFEELIEGMVDAVVVSDAEGKIVFWNPAATRIFGFTQDEALGESLDIIIPENQRGPHWDGYFHTMKTGETRYGNSILSVPAIDKEGNRLSIGFTVAMLKNDDDSVAGIAAIMRDETARFKEDRKLKKRLAQLEAQLEE